MMIRTSSERLKTKSAVIRWIIFSVIICICFAVSMTGTYVKPLLLIPVAISISVKEEELVSAIVGAFSGVMLDISCNTILGYNAVLMICECVFITLIFKHFLRRNIINIMILSSIFILFHGCLQYLFYNALWGYENVEVVYFEYILPSCFMTIISVLIVYPIIRKIRKRSEPSRIQTMKESRRHIKGL